MSLVVADINNTLDNLYAKGTVENFTDKFVSPAWKKIQRGSSQLISSKGINYLYKSGKPNYIRSKPFGTRPGEQFAKASHSKYALMNVAAIEDGATIEWDGDVDVQNNKPGLREAPAKGVDWVKSEMADIYKAYAETKSRQLWQKRTNEVARISARNTGTNEITCNNAGNLFHVQLIEEGMFLEVRDPSGVLRCYVVVDQVFTSQKKFTVRNDTNDALKYRIRDTSGAALTALPTAIADGDILYPEGGYNNGWAGFPYLYDDSGSFQGVSDRSSNKLLQGQKINAGGAALSFALLRRLVSDMRYRNNGNKVMAGFYASAQIDAWESTLIATQYNNQGASKADIGYDEADMKVLGRSFWYDSYVPRDEVHYADAEAVDRFELLEFGAVKNDAGGYVFQKPGEGMHYDAKQIHFRGIGNLGTIKPAEVGGYIYGLSVAGLSTGD